MTPLFGVHVALEVLYCLGDDLLTRDGLFYLNLRFKSVSLTCSSVLIYFSLLVGIDSIFNRSHFLSLLHFMQCSCEQIEQRLSNVTDFRQIVSNIWIVAQILAQLSSALFQGI